MIDTKHSQKQCFVNLKQKGIPDIPTGGMKQYKLTNKSTREKTKKEDK